MVAWVHGAWLLARVKPRQHEKISLVPACLSLLSVSCERGKSRQEREEKNCVIIEA